MRDIEERKTRDLRQVSLAARGGVPKLEERAIQLINIQDYTQSILRSITSGVLTVGPDGSVATANPAAERMLGMSEFEMVPKPIALAVPGRRRARRATSRRCSRDGFPLALREATLVTAQRQEIHVQASTSRMRAVGGTVLGAVVTLEDVSDIKALTEQLIRADRLAAMGELTAGVAHEVRNPLGDHPGERAAARGRASATRSASTRPAEVIKQEIDRLDKVIKALLDFGRPSKPTLVRDRRQRGARRRRAVHATGSRSSRDVHIDEQLAGRAARRCIGDPDQLKQVFLNLVTNAVQAMEDAGRHDQRIDDGGRRRLRRGRRSPTTGPGSRRRTCRKVFDPFFTKRAEGTGLGSDDRAPHRRRARRAYRSGERAGGHGVHRVAAGRDRASERRTRMSKRVLIVDDEKNMRWVLGPGALRRGLRGRRGGRRQGGARRGRRAGARRHGARPPDARARRHGGAAPLRGKGLTFPIIMLTAHGNVATAVEAMKAGASEYLTKPFDLEELKLAIEQGAASTRDLAAEVERLREELDRDYDVQGIVASDAADARASSRRFTRSRRPPRR